MRREDHVRGWCLALGTLALGVAATSASCLRVEREHCMFAGGDLACEGGLCVGAVGGASDAIAGADAHGCIAERPEQEGGWVHVRYGLPVARMIEESPAGYDPTTDTVEGVVEGVLQGRMLEFVPSKEGCTEELGRIEPERLSTIRTRVEGEDRRRTSSARLAFDTEEAGHIDEFNAELTRAIDEVFAVSCVEEIATTGTSTGPDATATDADSTTSDTPSCTHAQCLMLDPARPICADDGTCVACNATDAFTCEQAHPMRPVCISEGDGIGTCVQCTALAQEACQGETPICNTDTSTCVPCIAHAQCLDAVGSACHILTGECLPPDRVWHVDGDAAAGGDGSEDAPFETIAEALGNVGMGERGTIVLHQASDYAELVTIDGARVVAIVAPGSDRPRITDDAADGLVVVRGMDTVAYLDGLTLTLNGAGPGLSVDAQAHAHVDRCESINNSIGIEVTGEANLVLRNSIAWTATADLAALSVDGSTADVSYSTLAHTSPSFETYDAVQCNGTSMATVRNSVIVSNSIDRNGWNCPEGVVTHSAGENIPAGVGNVILCDEPGFECTGDIIPLLFQSASNLRLNASGQDFLADIPLFAPNDPPYDIDLDPRPSRSGTDHAGADVPP